MDADEMCLLDDDKREPPASSNNDATKSPNITVATSEHFGIETHKVFPDSVDFAANDYKAKLALTNPVPIDGQQHRVRASNWACTKGAPMSGDRCQNCGGFQWWSNPSLENRWYCADCFNDDAAARSANVRCVSTAG